MSRDTLVYFAVPGWSAYDHYADEVIRVAQQMLPPGATRRQMESAAARAWRQVRPHAASGPRINVVRGAR